MWIFILYIYFLGLNISQATGKVNSTQMYYVKLTIDKNAIGNITALLQPFGNSPSVKDLQKTTTCQSNSSDTECHCEPNHRWSEKVCQSEPECCDKNECTFKKGSSLMCVSSDTVTMSGTISLKDEFLDCLANKESDQFLNCNNKLLTRMKKEYSTLEGFDSITIDNYRQGSILADFEVTIANKVKSQDLIEVLKNLDELSSSLKLNTTGVVHLEMPPNPVCYNITHNLRCIVQEKLDSTPEWNLKRTNNEYEIHNGTEAVVTVNPEGTNVTIKHTTGPWEGEYTCLYRQISDSFTINHKASAVMDLILLPDIEITTIPSFRQCQDGAQDVLVKVQCETEQRKEDYQVSWTSQNSIRGLVQLDPRTANGILVHAAQILVSCNSTSQIPIVTCTYKNNCSQERNTAIEIHVIKEGDQFCKAEGDWEVTKAGFIAKLKCKKGVGQRERECKKGSTEATWEPEVEYCVNPEVKSLLNKAREVSTGRGSPDRNAAHVFSLLENVTENIETISTFANLNTSVEILFTISQEGNLRPNESVSNDFLESSSHLLDESLNKSWIHKSDNNSFSLASIYLSSVEKLVEMSNITGVPDKKNVEVAVSKCSQGFNCSNTVFNVSITLERGDPGEVKTVGFQQLHKYLPNKNKQFETNSIVVSATTGQNKPEKDLKITINFELLKKRPRNTVIRCVYWNSDNLTWSGEGCEAVDPSGKCVCKHLSSFAVLMSKYPLKVSGLEEMTFVGLAVSVISLAITLVIEMTVWNAVVKTNTLYIRHLAHINISLCLLIADCCFLASSESDRIPQVWCMTSAVLMHFCYLAMFFWMLCLSCTLLHQAVFLFHNVSKKHYLQFSVALGYVCPFLIVVITILANNIGAKGIYYSRETCWLVYRGLLKGSIFSFVIPVGIIVFINVFFMLVVIMKLLDHPKNVEKSHDKEKKAAKTVIRSVIFLTPVFGVTWIFGFFVMLLDLTEGIIAYAANYGFVLLNAFQGLFIMIVTCLADKLTRDALMKRFRKSAPASSTHSVTKLDSISK